MTNFIHTKFTRYEVIYRDVSIEKFIIQHIFSRHLLIRSLTPARVFVTYRIFLAVNRKQVFLSTCFWFIDNNLLWGSVFHHACSEWFNCRTNLSGFRNEKSPQLFYGTHQFFSKYKIILQFILARKTVHSSRFIYVQSVSVFGKLFSLKI